MNFQTLELQVKNGIGVVTLNRPDKLNAINHQMREELWEAVQKAEVDPEISVLIFSANGRAFSAGGDLSFFEADWEDTSQFRREISFFTRTFDLLETMEKPVIAAINGICTGAGLQLTLSCDLRIASAKAEFAFLEKNIGLIPGAGGCSRLVKLVGYGKAKEMILLGEKIPALRAYEMGLINKVVPHEHLEKEVRHTAEALLQKKTQATGLAKRILHSCVNSDFQTGRLMEFLGQSILVKTSEHKEGIRAFREKRKSLSSQEQLNKNQRGEKR